MVSRLQCPISEGTSLRLHAVEATRGDAIVTDVPGTELLASDDVQLGVIVESDSGIAHPIAESIAMMLPNPGVQAERHTRLLTDFLPRTPTDLRPAIRETLHRMRSATAASHADWDRSEMAYYDRDVAGPAQRQEVLHVLRTTPHWGTFLPRRRYVLDHVASRVAPGPLLELGCGTARTVAWTYPPRRHKYRYVGLDISLGRLLVARQLIPEGDYIQGSAVRLPVRAGAFPVIIAFGAIHHLPDQAACFRECHRALAPKGLLGFHEPIRKPLLFPSATGIRQLMATYEHSEHDREIHVEETIALLQSLGMRIHSARYFVSPLRTVIASILNRSPRLMRVRWIARATDIADGIFLFTLGRLRRSLGPHALALVASKSQIPAEH